MEKRAMIAKARELTQLMELEMIFIGGGGDGGWCATQMKIN